MTHKECLFESLTHEDNMHSIGLDGLELLIRLDILANIGL